MRSAFVVDLILLDFQNKGNMPARYDLDDSKIVEMYKSGNTFYSIAEEFNISRDTVRKRLKENGIISTIGRKKKIFDIEFAYSFYKDGNTIQNTANKFCVSPSTIIKNFENSGYPRNRCGPERKISLNDDTFAIPNVSNCYWAGFIAADGNVQQNQLSICLKLDDLKHLEKFKNYLSLIGTKVFIKSNKFCIIRFRSDSIINDLKNNFNIIPNKSLILQPPKLINDNLARHYIRGYFDGDGCVSKNSNTGNLSFEIYSGSQAILKWMLQKIRHNLNIGKKIKLNKKVNTYRLSFCGNQQVPTLVAWLYEDCGNNFLERKKIKFESFYKRGGLLIKWPPILRVDQL